MTGRSPVDAPFGVFGGAPAGVRARSFVVDSARRVVESDAPELPAGEMLSASSWLGRSVSDVVDAARVESGPQLGVGQDAARGAHWLLVGSAAPGDPKRVAVVAVDATPAVVADRAIVLSRLIHSIRNASFALQSVLEAMALERPGGDRLDDYLLHLRSPADRLSATMARLVACIAPPRLSLRRIRAGEIVDRAMSSVAPECRPESVTLCAPSATLCGDLDLLSDTLIAMLESGGAQAGPTIELDEIAVGLRLHTRFVVERVAAIGEDAGALWDMAGGPSLDASLRLTAGRAIVVAHGGDVLAEGTGTGRVRLGMRLPLAGA